MKRQTLILSAALLVFIAVAVLMRRTARVHGARVVHVEDGHVPVAEVALTYSAGPRPMSVIVDLRGAGGSSSATVEGDEDMVQIPLAGPLGERYTIDVTASSRIMGRTVARQRSFAA